MSRFPWRFGLYAVILIYLALDLKLCRGPLHQALSRRGDEVAAAAAEHRWVAVVNREPLTAQQLDLAVERHLHQRGIEAAAIPPANLATIRRAVLNSLIDETLVRQYAGGEQFAAPAEEVEAFVAAWESQFPDEEDRARRSAAQGLDAEAAAAELAAIWSRKRWLEHRIAPAVEVTDEELREWFEANREAGEGFAEPERVRARHIFLAAGADPAEEASREALLGGLRERIESGEAAFAEAAAAHSEDPRSAAAGGDLGWFSRDRVPGGFADAVFSLEPGETAGPLRSDAGWHLVEVLERRPGRPLEFEEIAGEIRAHLENERTVETVRLLARKLRRVASIRLFLEHM